MWDDGEAGWAACTPPAARIGKQPQLAGDPPIKEDGRAARQGSGHFGSARPGERPAQGCRAAQPAAGRNPDAPAGRHCQTYRRPPPVRLPPPRPDPPAALHQPINRQLTLHPPPAGRRAASGQTVGDYFCSYRQSAAAGTICGGVCLFSVFIANLQFLARLLYRSDSWPAPAASLGRSQSGNGAGTAGGRATRPLQIRSCTRRSWCHRRPPPH